MLRRIRFNQLFACILALCLLLPFVPVRADGSPDYTTSKSGYTGYTVSETGYDDHGTIGVFIPRWYYGQEFECGADGGLEWRYGAMTFFTADSRNATPVTEELAAGLVYTGALNPGITQLSGSAWLILKDRAYDNFGNTYDVRIDYTNFELGSVMGHEAEDGGVLLSKLFTYGQVNACSYALKKSQKFAGDSATGVAVDLTFSVLDDEGNSISRPTILYVDDLDASDHIALADARKYGSTNIQGRYDMNGNPLPFVESVYMKTAVDTVYVSTNNVVDYSSEPGRFIGTTGTGASQAHPTSDAGLLFETTTDQMALAWTGSQCETVLFSAARSYKVTSRVVGDYPEGGTITNGGNGPIEVPYMMDYGLQIQAADGYVPENVWVDGELIDLSGVIEGREGFYLFEAVDADHTIDVSFRPIPMNILIHKVAEDTAQPLSGAVFTVCEWNGAEYTPIAEGSGSSAVLAESETGEYSGTVYYSAQNEGKFKLVETEAPHGYTAGYETYFEIDPAGSAEQAFEDTAANHRHLVSITIKKVVPAADLYEDHGSADFVFRIDGIDPDGNEKTYYRLISMTAEDAAASDPVVKSAEVLQIPEGSYTVTEMKTSRFALTDIAAGEGGFTVSKQEVRQSAEGFPVLDGFAGGYLTAEFNEVQFVNRKENWGDLSHSSAVVNHIGTAADNV